LTFGGTKSRIDSARELANVLSLPWEKGVSKMPLKQGSLDLLEDPIARELMQSKIPARLAYVWTDGTPRVVPIWFHWDGREFVLATPPKAPKLKALARNPKVALTIDDNNFPHKVLLVRGTAQLETVEGMVPEYAASAERYFGREQGQAWVTQLRTITSTMVRIAITPEWVGILDFQTRFPSAISK
jgi:PPOX class probable F420-dependent enzyme